MTTSSELVRRAEGRGVLSKQSSAALQDRATERKIEGTLEDAELPEGKSDILFITLQPDDSSSMEFVEDNFRVRAALPGEATSKGALIIAHNELIDHFADSPLAPRVWLQTRYLNGKVLNPARPLVADGGVVPAMLDADNYRCDYMTPLFSETIVTLGSVLALTEEMVEDGHRVRTATLILTDGAPDQGERAHLPALAGLVQDLRNVGDHIVAGMGFACPHIGDQPRRDSTQSFRETFLRMGIDEQYIFTADSREEILEGFRMFTQYAFALALNA